MEHKSHDERPSRHDHGPTLISFLLLSFSSKHLRSYEFNIFPLLLARVFFGAVCLTFVSVPLLDLTLNTVPWCCNIHFSIYKGVIVHCFCQLIFNFHSDNISTGGVVRQVSVCLWFIFVRNDEGADCDRICDWAEFGSVPQWPDSRAPKSRFVRAASDPR